MYPVNSDRFVVLVISHGRPRNVLTAKALEAQGYTGDWRIVVDDEDATKGEYLAHWGSGRVVIFPKAAYVEEGDRGDNFPSTRTPLYARNACFDIAKDLGADSFLLLDDDYKSFQWRWEDGTRLATTPVGSLDRLFAALADLGAVPAISGVSLTQGSWSYIGGPGGPLWRHKLTRRAAGSFLFRADDSFRFVARVNEDTVGYALQGSRGRIFLTTAYAMLDSTPTLKAAGGLTEEYAWMGSYVKAFYAVMMMPSAIKGVISEKGVVHSVRARNVYPKILEPGLRKGLA